MNLEKVFPALSWIRGYKSSYLYFDFIAGINMGVSMIPKAMAYAVVAGLPPIYGLYASFVAPLVAILFGSNRLLFTGPVGVMTVLVYSSLSPIAEPNSQEWIGLAATLSLLVGIFILFIALLRWTFILNMISHAAVIGFVNAAALIISATQLKYIFGVHTPNEEFMIMMFVDIIKHLPETNVVIFGLSIVAFALMIGIHRWKPKAPEVLLVLVPLTLVVYFLQLDRVAEVSIVGSLPMGVPTPALPGGLAQTGALVGSAVVIAIVGMTESYSISKIVAKNTKQKVDYNQEFIGQGLANIATSVFQGYPVCGSFSGTSVNWSSGARTGLSLVIFSILSLLAITVLTPLFYYLPKFMLAVIVILAVMKLFKPKQMLEIYRINKYDGAVAFVTFGVSLIIKPDEGIIMGVVLALVLYVWNTMHTRVYLFTKDPKTGYFITHSGVEKSPCPQIVFLKPEGPFIYVNAEHMRDEVLQKMDNHPQARVLIMDMAAVYTMDASGADALKDIYDEMDLKGITLEMIHVESEILKAMEEIGIAHRVVVGLTKTEALSSALKVVEKGICRECKEDIFKECREAD
jgi:SulP family sulfate permease